MPDASERGNVPYSQRLRRFALVGATGFAIDAVVLTLLISRAGLDPFTARVFAISASAFTTWQLNRRITWWKSSDGAAREGSRYFSVVASAALLNYLIYSAVLVFIQAAPPLAALVVGTGSAMVWSFVGFDRFAFRQ